MAGNELEVIVPVSIYHHWEMLEDHLVELLSKSFGLDTFGCELTLLTEDTLCPLSDPIHEELWDGKGFHLVIQKSLRKVSLKEQIQRDVYEDHPKATWVPANKSGILPAKAFFSIARLRHVQVEAGFHTSDRRGAIATPSPLSNCPAPWLQSRMLPSKGVMRSPQWQCQDACLLEPDSLQNAVPSSG